MTTHRLLTEAELAMVRDWIATLPGTGSGRLPGDLSLLLGHLDAQAAELRRERERGHRLADAMTDLMDLIEGGGANDLRQAALARARAVLDE